MSDKYILNGHTPVPVDDLMVWATLFENANARRVDETKIGDEIRVSTVFLGLNHQFGDGPPLLFETMIFGGDLDGHQERCSTWEQAEEQHEKAVELVTPKRP